MFGFRYQPLQQLLTHKRWRRPAALAIVTLFVLSALSGCFSLFQPNNDGADAGAAQTSPYTGAVEFSCNQACAARGQCGTAVDQTDRVFMKSDAPAVDNHDMLIVPGSRGTIVNTANQTLILASTQEPFEQPFHLVQVDNGPIGWVAEWCVVPTN